MSRTIIGKYIVSQTTPWLFVGLFGAAFVFLATQLVRIAPVFAGAGMGLASVAEAVLLLLVPVIGWALTPAFLVAVFSAAGKMAVTGELGALDALAIPPPVRLRPAICFAVILSLVSAWIWLDAAPGAGGRLYDIAADLAENALIGQISPNRINTPVKGVTFYAASMNGRRRFDTVFVSLQDDTGPVKQVAARRAEIERTARGIITIYFHDGHLFLQPRARTSPSPASADDMPNAAITFESLKISIPISTSISARLNFIPKYLLTDTEQLLRPPPPQVDGRSWRYTLWRRIAAPIGMLALSISGIFIAFGTTWKRRGSAVLAASMLFAAYQIAGRAGESLMGAGALSPPTAALLPIFMILLLSGMYFGAKYVISFRRTPSIACHRNCWK